MADDTTPSTSEKMSKPEQGCTSSSPQSPELTRLKAARIVRLPGFIDVHVHLREPGGEHKETWASGTAAALAGGFTLVCAMPNTKPAVTDLASLKLMRERAARGARCDYAVYVQGTGSNCDPVPAELLQEAATLAGVKLYLNYTFNNQGVGAPLADPKLLSAAAACCAPPRAAGDGEFEVGQWRQHFAQWPVSTPIVVHAERRTVAAVALLALLHQRPVHIAHVALREEIELVVACKRRGLPVTCEVTPHHLFLTREEALARCEPGKEGRTEVRPRLATADDVAALWHHMDDIDIFATDHAPHLLAEKDALPSVAAPPGFAGLETALPLLLTAVSQGRLTLAQLEDRLVHNPRRIFGLPPQPNTYVHIDLDCQWHIAFETAYSLAGWTPFAGWPVCGRIVDVTLRGTPAYSHREGLLAPPGFGQELLVLQPRR